MDDRLRETLSAMMDDEADELSVRRLLSQEEQVEVRAQWQRWQSVHDLMHRGSSPADGIDISASVREVLDGRTRQPEPALSQRRNTPVRWQWPAVAMITASLLVGFGAGAGWDSGNNPPNGLASASVSEAAVNELSGEASPVRELALQGLDEQQWEHMSRYLLEHAQHNSVGAGQGSVGYARLVSASGAY